MELVIWASAESTNGVLGIVDEIDAVDAPLHLHEREDELFYVLEGRHVFTVGDTESEAGTGDLVFGPRVRNPGSPYETQKVWPSRSA